MLSRIDTEKHYEQYKKMPTAYNEEQLHELKQSSKHYGIPFAINEIDNNFQISRAMRQLGEGFIEGFTTLSIAEPAKNSGERIARSIGSLAGFVGFIPGVPSIRGMSIPMQIASKATKGATQVSSKIMAKGVASKYKAFKSAAKFFSKPLAQDMLQGSFHMGTAMGTSAWQGGVDEMLKGFAYGAMTGAVDRGISNFIKMPGSAINSTESQVVKAVAASAFQGLPHTIQGATTEEQVYQYLLGAYFGAKDPNYAVRRAQLHMSELHHMQRHKNALAIPEDLQGWAKMSPEEQGATKDLYTNTFGDNSVRAYLNDYMAKKLNIDIKNLADNELQDLMTKMDKASSLDNDSIDNLTVEIAREQAKTAGYDADFTPNRFYRWVDKEMSNEYTIEGDEPASFNKKVEISEAIDKKWNELSAPVKHNTFGKTFEQTKASLDKIEGISPEEYDMALNEINMEFNNIKAERIPQGRTMIDYLKKSHPETMQDMTEEQENYWINRGIRTARDRDTAMATYILGESKKGIDPEGKVVFEQAPNELKMHTRGRTPQAGGGFKNTMESEKLIESVYNKAFKNAFNQDNNDFAYLKTDTITFRDKISGKLKDISLADYETASSRDKNMIPYDDVLKDILTQAEKKGYYYMGGRGDESAMYMAKYHPDVQLMASKAIDTEFNIIAKAAKNSINEKINLDMYGKEKKTMGNYKKAFVSNVKYELSLNGLDTNDYATLFGDGNWVNSAKKYNKRSQVWFNSGYSVDPKEFMYQTNNKWHNFITDKDGNKTPALDYDIRYDIDELLKDQVVTDNTLAQDMLQRFDGVITILPEHMDIINRSSGLATNGKKNKSFITAPDKDYGALLGKYMFHIAPEPEARWMRAHGRDMILHVSAAKQFGKRNAYHMEWNPTKGEFSYKDSKLNDVDAKSIDAYKMPVDAIKSVLSERTDINPKQAKKYSIVKQILTNLTAYISGKQGKTADYLNLIDDMFKETSARSIRGTDEYYNKLEDYVLHKSNDIELENDIIENLDQVGINQIMNILNKKGMERIGFKMLMKMTSQAKEFTQTEYDMGEMSSEEMANFVNASHDIESTVTKHLLMDKGTFAAVTNKYNLPYLEEIIRSYILDRGTRPKIGNTTTHRMSPFFDSQMHSGNTAQLNRNIIDDNSELAKVWGKGHRGKDFFFLNKGEGEILIDFGGKKKKLSVLWDNFKKASERGDDTSEYKSLFEAALVRVPMDSNSGTQILKFGGFTDTEGGGSIMHPSKMELLGGADLDGDKNFIYWGGRGEVGSKNEHASGFRDSWKQYYKDNADEFYEYKNLETNETMTVDEYNNFDKSKTGNTRFKNITAYHGTDAAFDVFDFSKAGSTTRGSDTGGFVFFSSDKNIAKTYTDYERKSEIKRISLEIRQMEDGSFQRYIDSGDMTKKDVLQSIADMKNELSKIKGKVPKGKVMGRKISFNNPLVIDGGKLIDELSDFGVVIDYLGSPGFLKKYSDGKYDGVIVENFSHGLGTEKNGTMYMVSKNASIDKYDNLDAKPSTVTRQEQVVGRSTKDYVKVQKPNKKAKDPHTQKTYESAYAVTGGKKVDLMEDSFLRFSPEQRLLASRGASEGRGELGGAVINKALIMSYYSSLRGTDSNDKFVFKTKPNSNGETKDIEITITPKSTDMDLRRFSESSRASIAIPSDPMEQAEIFKSNVFFKNVFETLFDIQGKYVGKGAEYMNKSYPLDNTKLIRHAKKGFYSKVMDTNSAFYGRDNLTRAKLTPLQIMSKLRSSTFGENERGSFLSKLQHELGSTKFGIDLLGRMNMPNVNKVVNSFDKFLQEGDMKYLRKVLNRVSLKSPVQAYMKVFMEDKPWIGENYDAIVNDTSLDTIKKYIGDMKPTTAQLENRSWREGVLSKAVKQMEDFVTNSLTDISTMRIVPRYIDALPTSKRVRNKIIRDTMKFSDDLKNSSYLRMQAKRAVDSGKASGKDMYGKDQQQIDAEIIQWKETHSQAEADLLDIFLLGSYNMGDGIGKYDAAKLKKTAKTKDEIADIEQKHKNSINTKVSRLAYQSKAINSEVLSDWMATYSDTFSKFTNDDVDLNIGINPNIEVNTKSAQAIADNPVAARTNTVNRIIDKKGKVGDFDFLQYPTLDPVSDLFVREMLDNLATKTVDVDGKKVEQPLIAKGKISNELAQLGNEVTDLIRHFTPESATGEIQGFIKDITNKSFNVMNVEDWKVVKRTLEDYKGNWIDHKLLPAITDKGEFRGIQPKHWLYKMFPGSLSRRLMAGGFHLKENHNWYMSSKGKVLGKTYTPSLPIDNIKTWAHRTDEAMMGFVDRKTSQYNESIDPYLSITSHKFADAGLKLFRNAMAEREGNDAFIGMIRAKFPDRDDLVQLYQGHKLGVQDANEWALLKDNIFTLKKGEDVFKMTGKEIVEDINKTVTEYTSEMKGFLQGKEGALDGFMMKGKDGKVLRYSDGTPKINFGNKKVDGANSILVHFKGFLDKHMDMPRDIGVDGMRLVARSQLLSTIDRQIDRLNRDNVGIKDSRRIDLNSVKKKILSTPSKKTTGYPSEFYLNHTFDNAKLSEKYLVEALERLQTIKSVDEQLQVKEQIVNEYQKMNTRGEVDDLFDMVGHDIVDEVIRHKETRAVLTDSNIKWLNKQASATAQQERKFHVGGWSVEPDVLSKHFKDVASSYFKNLAHIALRNELDVFDTQYKQWDRGLKDNWIDIMKLYGQQALGNPSVIPQHMLDNKGLALKHSLYAEWSDGKVANTLNKVFKKLGIKNKLLPPKFQDLSKLTPRDLARWSNIEAKYQVATLLAHPKSAITNVFGATIHDGINVGFSNTLKVNNLKYLQETISPRFKSDADVDKWMVAMGINEDYMRHELGLERQYSNKKVKAALDEAMDVVLKDPAVEDKNLFRIAKKHGITDSAFKKAAWFMQTTERRIRRNSFLMHYINAMDQMDGMVDDPLTNPYLIAMAKKGVSATQFMYGNAFRPMFAATSLGKVMNRFQTYSWNSVRFRKNIVIEAKRLGFRQGTHEFNRYKRMVTADMIGIALANVFAYSIFDTALPAPLNWLQDFADLIFGDEKERDRAFFGVLPGVAAPLQLFIPPAGRLIAPTISAMITDDYSRLASYHIWTAFPFGRLGKTMVDIGKQPMSAVDKLTGIPIIGLQKQKKISKSYDTRAHTLWKTQYDQEIIKKKKD